MDNDFDHTVYNCIRDVRVGYRLIQACVLQRDSQLGQDLGADSGMRSCALRGPQETHVPRAQATAALLHAPPLRLLNILTLLLLVIYIFYFPSHHGLYANCAGTHLTDGFATDRLLRRGAQT